MIHKASTLTIFTCSLSLVACWFTEQSDASMNEIQQKFIAANKFYEDRNYTQAIESYENLLRDYKIQTEIIYYNLGNAYYKANQIGKAILNYERAIKLNPRDEDVVYNLRYVRQIIKDETVENIFQKLYMLLKLNELKTFLSVVNVIFFVSLGIYITKKVTIFKQLSTILGVIFAIFLLWTVTRISAENKIFAIVTSAAVIRSGPGENYTACATVPEGKKLLILGEQENYFAVALSIKPGHVDRGAQSTQDWQKYKGWIEKVKLEKI
ncbi:MAG: tetratricopeptide repeat protein [Elusimicrobiota bacterium]|nr:tetratricopeptide repeat protein [Elusimicrobiota bacterium]